MRTPASRSRLLLLTSLLMGSGLTGAVSGAAQEPQPQSPVSAQPREPFHASPYLPLGHWSYPIVEYWIAAGRISSLSPFVKPYRRIEVARALANIDDEPLSAGERGWLNRLRSEFAAELSRLGGASPRPVGLSLELGAGAQYASQTHRDLLRPELEGEFSDAELLGDLQGRVEGAGGPLAGAVFGRYNGIYLEDPQFPGGRVVESKDALLFERLAFRMEEAYVEVQSRYARLSVGQIYRNWGAPNLDGFLRSDYAYSEPDIGYRFGTDRIFMVGMFGSYRDFKADTAHYVAIHRLEIRPIDNLMVSVSESSVHGGPGQGVDFQLVNPLSIWMVARSDEDPPHNKMGQADVWWRAAPGLTAYGSLMVDGSRREESKFAGSLGMELSRLAPGFLLRANFSFVESLTYTPNNATVPWEEYSVERIGIGRDKTDLFLVSLEGEWFPRAGLWLQPRLDIQVKGEFDLRRDRPPPETLPNFPHILVGEAETTVRPALAGAWRSGWRVPLEVKWDVGVNFIQDHANTAGDNRTEFVGSVGVLLKTPRWTLGIR
jgi:hypothetical protein